MDLERLVLEWQTPLYHLAYRMLGNEADAADATQEVFPAARRPAAGLIRNFARERETRRRRERAAPPRARTEEDAVERKDVSEEIDVRDGHGF